MFNILLSPSLNNCPQSLPQRAQSVTAENGSNVLLIFLFLAKNAGGVGVYKALDVKCMSITWSRSQLGTINQLHSDRFFGSKS